MSTCKTKPCGCNDAGLTTNPAYAADCPNPEACAETFSGECIVYTGDTIIDYDTNLPYVSYGDRFNEIVQMLILLNTNPTCVGSAATGLMSTAITTTSISVKWNAVACATGYTVQYSNDGGLSWASISTVPPVTSLVISALTPGTEYYIRVSTACPITGSCYSLTIVVTTKIII